MISLNRRTVHLMTFLKFCLHLRRLLLDVEQTTVIYFVILSFFSDTVLNFTTNTNKSDLQHKNASLFIQQILSTTCTVTPHTINVKKKNTKKLQTLQSLSRTCSSKSVNSSIFRINPRTLITDERDHIRSAGCLNVV